MLYRHFDKNRRLLYVGISEDALKRAAAHGVKPWGHLIAKITVEHLPDRATAEAAEKAAIIAECPRFNVVHSRQRPLLPPASRKPSPAVVDVKVELDLVKHLADVERAVLVEALRVYGGNRTMAARRIGLNLRQMRYRMEQLGVAVEKPEPVVRMTAAMLVDQPPRPKAPKPQPKRPTINLAAYVPGQR